MPQESWYRAPKPHALEAKVGLNPVTLEQINSVVLLQIKNVVF